LSIVQALERSRAHNEVTRRAAESDIAFYSRALILLAIDFRLMVAAPEAGIARGRTLATVIFPLNDGPVRSLPALCHLL
jgi:hypothetical protein